MYHSGGPASDGATGTAIARSVRAVRAVRSLTKCSGAGLRRTTIRGPVYSGAGCPRAPFGWACTPAPDTAAITTAAAGNAFRVRM